MAEAERIADQLERAVNGRAWHGPALLPLLRDVTAAQAAGRLLRGAHSIAELVQHATTWLEIARQRIEGTAPRRVSARRNWPPTGGLDQAGWRAAVDRLKDAARALAATARTLDDRRLDRPPPAGDDTWSVYETLHGAIQHTLYHAGQIAILKKGVARHGYRR